jgi:hypothetical protein
MNMDMFIDALNKSWAIDLTCISYIPSFIRMGRSNCLSVRTQILVAGLHIILVMFLKHRAAPHRRIRRWINAYGENSNHLWVHLKEAIQCGPKMSPSSCPLLSGICRVLCHWVVWKLFPQSFALHYTSIAWMSHVIQWFIAASLCNSIDRRKYVIYDG